jgi:diguanylate cyclase (GGDEF)-like protein/PAS domain S-box-containing protein
VLRVLVVGPDDLSGVIGPTVLGRPDIDRIHEPRASSVIDTAGRYRPHMVVLGLPREEAAQVARGLRRDPATRPTAIVWLNRSEPPDVEAELRSAGINAVIPIPIDPFLWDRRLEELLSVPARRARRIPVRLLDWSRFMVSADEDEATILNIGARGVLLETARALELGTKVGLNFRLPGSATDVGVVGQVARLAEQEEGRHRVGVEFLVYRGDARERVAAFVDAEPEPERPGAPAAAIVRPFEEAREWEEELRASELRKALILDSALDCIVTVDHEGRILEFNSTARRSFGYTRSEVLGREVADKLVPPALRDELRRRLRAFVATGESEDLGRRREAVAMRADGSLLPVEIVVVPAYVKGRVLLTAYIRDLTDRRRGQRLGAARHRATQALTGSLSLAEAAPAVLDALVQGLECPEARLWVTEGDPAHLDLAAASGPSGARPRTDPPDETLARRVLDAGEAASVEGGQGPDADASLAVPVRAAGELLGVLETRCARAQLRDEEFVGVVADIGSQMGLFLRRQRAEADLQRLGRYDSLTGLPNRSFFLETLERTLARAARRRLRVALIFVDLDGFKVVNDLLGHAAGDAVLQSVAERLRAGTRSSDLVARIGGDEFTLLVQDLARADDAALVASALLERLARPFAVHDHEIPLSASAGIAVFPEDGAEAVELLRHADLAMYRAKQDGKNNYRFFTAEMSERARERMLLLNGLRAALEHDQFELVYLPIIRRDRPPVLEALLRWRHPRLGVVLPASFIVQAEESGLILPIGAHVLRTATRFLASLARADPCVAVNLSPRQFLQPDIERAVEDALSASGLAPSRLELELTEQTVMNDAEEVTQRLRRLREMGVELALDDFGTGYFSIARIRELGFHRLKIDRSLVCDLPGNRDHAVQIEAILALARGLGLEVVAEGVETEAQRAFLEERGCSDLQGYLLSPPLAPEEVPAFLARHPPR